jgi:hypothetical protein
MRRSQLWWKLTRTRVVTAVAVLLAAPAVAGEPLDIRVRPHVSVEPATLALDVVVERHSDNRAIQVVVDSGEYLRSSFVQLDGEGAPRITSIRYPGLPAGSYELRAILYGAGAQPRATATKQFEVLGRAGR